MWRVAIGLALLLAGCAPEEHRAEAATCSPDLPASNAGHSMDERFARPLACPIALRVTMVH